MLAHWNNSPRIDMPPLLDILYWFRANQILVFLLNAACLATNTNFIVFSLTRSWLSPTIFCTRGEHANRCWNGYILSYTDIWTRCHVKKFFSIQYVLSLQTRNQMYYTGSLFDNSWFRYKILIIDLVWRKIPFCMNCFELLWICNYLNVYQYISTGGAWTR